MLIQNGPGEYAVLIGFSGADYTVTVEECVASEGSAPPVASSPPSSAPVSVPASSPASSPESTSSSAPTRDSARDSAVRSQNVPGPDSECPGARVVNRTSGNGNKQSPVFDVRGDSFRVTTTLETNSPRFLTFDLFVYKEGGGQFVTTIGRESPGTDSSIVNESPGAFYLDILSANTKYFVTVEDCTGAPNGQRPGPRPGPINKPEGVIPETQVIKVPNTGGPPYLAVGGLVLLGAALIVGRGVLKR